MIHKSGIYTQVQLVPVTSRSKNKTKKKKTHKHDLFKNKQITTLANSNRIKMFAIKSILLSEFFELQITNRRLTSIRKELSGFT